MGEPNHEAAVSEISRVLTAAGYDCEVEEGLFNLSGVRDTKCVIVMCSDDLNLLQRFDMTPYTIMLGGSKVRCDKLIFTGNTYFQPKESALWTKEKLLENIARAAEARIFGIPFDIESTPSYAYPASVTPDIPAFGYDLMLPIKISAKDAVRVAHQDGPTVLRMIPYWYYHYTSGGEATYKGKSVCFDAEGDGWINAVNGLDWEFEADAVPMPAEIPKDADVIQPITQKEEARQTVITSLIKKLTRRVRIKTTAGDAIFAEEKEFKPTEDNIVLKIEKVYVPVWQVRGKKDIIEVNAFNGQELALPSDEGCEVF
ncbi:MAG: hypothetical protein Q4Q04_02605 [Methanocorpusculum sp.]|nr:hypothetical protein [Methanocorpusculum sp.]